jgi:hypothetical protein
LRDESAATATAADPDRSDRAIAADLGVNQSTVSRIRQKTDAYASVEGRIGRDGRRRRLPKPKAKQLEDPTNEEKMFLVRADLAVEFAAYGGRVTKETIEATRTAARAWQDLLSKQERT